MGTSILTELTARKVNKLLGHFPLRFAVRGSSGQPGAVSVVTKVKPLDEEVMLMAKRRGAVLRRPAGQDLQQVPQQDRLCRLAPELAIYASRDPRFVRHTPRIFGTYRNDLREAYVIVMERLDDLVLMNSAEEVSGWRERAHRSRDPRHRRSTQHLVRPRG